MVIYVKDSQSSAIDRYFVWIDGSTYYATNGITGAVTSNSDLKTLVQAIIDGINPANTPTVIEFGQGNFTLHSQIAIPSSRIGNITILGQGMQRTNILIGSGFNSLGGTSPILIGTAPTITAGITGTLTANKTVGQTSVSMSTGDVAKFAVNNYVLLRSTKLWCDPAVASSLCKQGEIHRVSSASGTTVGLQHPGYDTYNTANTAELINLESYFMRNVTVKGMSIKKDAAFTGNTNPFLTCWLIDNLLIDEVEIVNDVTQFDSAITLKSCINTRILNCRFKQDPSQTYNDQYGITIRACCQNVVIDHCQSYGRYRHPFEVATGNTTAGFEGPPRHIVTSNCQSLDSEVAAFSTHGDGEYITVSNCQAAGMRGGYGFYARTRNVKFVNCTVNSSNNHGIYILENGHGAEVINCNISNITATDTNGIRVDTDVNNVTIRGNRFYNCQDQAIYIVGDTNENIIIDGNMFDSCSGDNTATEGIIECANTTNDLMIINNDFVAGTIPTNSRSLVIAGNTAGLDYSYNNVRGLTNKDPIIPLGCTDVVVSNNIGLPNYNQSINRPDVGKYGSWHGRFATSADGLLNGGISNVTVGTGAGSAGFDSTGSYRTYDTGATINSIFGMHNGSTLIMRITNAYFKTAIYLNNVTDVRIFAGLVASSSAPASAADPLNALAGVGLWLDTAVSANWKRAHNDASGAGVYDDTGLAAATATLYPVEIYAHNDDKFRFVFNNTVTNITTDIPSSTAGLSLRVYIENTTGSSRTMRHYYLVMRNDK